MPPTMGELEQAAIAQAQADLARATRRYRVAQEALDKLGVDATVYDPKTVDAIDARVTALGDESARLKHETREKRLAIRAEIDALLEARGVQFELRESQPGDVTINVPAIGTTNDE